MADVIMPQLGETVTEGTITRWFKSVGDTVAEDEVLFEVSTDKVDSEVPSPVSGVITEIRVPEGELVEVGEVLAVVGDDAQASTGSEPTETAPGTAEPSAPESPGVEAAGPRSEEQPTAVEARPAETPAEPAAAAPASEPPPSAASAPEPPDPEPSSPEPASSPPAGSGDLPLSPVVRRLVSQSGIDPTTIAGTGLGGRITRADVESAIKEQGLSLTGRASTPATQPTPAAPTTPAPPAAPAAAPTPEAPAPPAAPAAAPTPEAPAAPAAAEPAVPVGSRDTRVPMNTIRRRTGEHMVMSKATSPHVLTAVEVDFEGVEEVRRAHRAEWRAEEGFSLTYLPFISRAVVDALREYPNINASVGDDELIVHHDINLAIAVDLDFDGLIAPVIRDADTKRLRALARETSDKAARARSKTLSPDEVGGGTFTITNPGQYGTLMQFPIINQPQVAILSTDGIRRKPVVVTDEHGNEAIAIHSVGILALAWDHRAFDGAYVAAFLDHLRSIIETRDWEPEVS